MDSNNEPVPNLELAIKRSMLAKNKLAMIVKKPDGAVHFSCVECSAWYHTKEELERHLLIHNKDYRYLCGICGTGLKRKEHLDRHTLEHQEVRPHVCPDCGKAFKRKEHLNIHRSIHSGDKSEACPVCSKTFYRKDHLRKHLQTHTKVFLEQNLDLVGDQGYADSSNDQGYTEVDNDQGYADVGNDQGYAGNEEGFGDIKQEIIDEYSTPIVDKDEEMMEAPEEKYSMTEQFNGSQSANRPYMCLVCHKSYKRKDHLKIHSWTHMKKDKICSECGRGFHTEEQLLEHMSVHLQPYTMYSGDEDYTQGEPIANDAYSSDNSHLIVRSVRLNGESRPHECEICHRRFKRKQHLKVHLNVHNKHQFSVWCSVCGEGFLSNEHFESHHCQAAAQENVTEYEEKPPQSPPVFAPQEAKKENKYPQEFVDVGELAALDCVQYVEVEERELPTPQRVFVCKYCSKPFKRKDHYKIHLHIHTGIKSFFCTECGKGFYRKDHLQKHMLVHNKVQKPKKEMPDLYPINKLPKKKQVLPEITIHAPSNTKLRVPLQIKVPYQMVMSLDNGEQRAVTIDPQASPVAS